jgi:anion-transporting  ArsA/GET3 family ATPase
MSAPHTRVLVCCGSGGVGKTSLSAALAIKLARSGLRVAVLTIDPARRLADGLGVGALGNDAREVPLRALFGDDGGGRLDALMLDARSTFDNLVRRFAPDARAAQRVLDNRYYQFASTRLGGSHEYMAMERLLELVQSDAYDVVVLDTPPTRHALDFLRAPERMSGLMDQGVLKWLVMPAGVGGWRALEFGSEAVSSVLKALLGEGTVGEIAEFFDAFRGLGDGMRQRSLAVRALLRAPTTRFFLVSSPAAAARAEALFFLAVLREERMPFGGFLINRVAAAPPAFSRADWAGRSPAEALALDAVDALCAEQADLAAAHAKAVAALRAEGPAGAACWLVPEQSGELHELSALIALGAALPDAASVWGADGPGA